MRRASNTRHSTRLQGKKGVSYTESDDDDDDGESVGGSGNEDKEWDSEEEEEDEEEEDEDEEEEDEEEEDEEEKEEEEEDWGDIDSDSDAKAEEKETEQAHQKVKRAANGLLNENASAKVLGLLSRSTNQDLLARLAFGTAADGLSLRKITDALAKDLTFLDELHSKCNTQALQDLKNMPIIGLQSRLTNLSTHLIHLLALLLGALAFPRTGDTALVVPAAPVASGSSSRSSSGTGQSAAAHGAFVLNDRTRAVAILASIGSMSDLVDLLFPNMHWDNDIVPTDGMYHTRAKKLLNAAIFAVHPDKNLDMPEEACEATKPLNVLNGLLEAGTRLRDFPDHPSAATRPKSAAKPCADMGTLVTTLKTKIDDLRVCSPEEVLRMAYRNLYNLYELNPFTPQSLFHAAAAECDSNYIRTYQGEERRPTMAMGLNTPLPGGGRRVLFQFVVQLHDADDDLLALLGQTSKKKVFPLGRVIHWGEQKAVYLGLEDDDAQLSTARFIIKKAREWLLAPGALGLWAYLHANAADKFEWTNVRRNGGEAVPVPSNALRLAGNVLLPICDLADEDLDSESCAARPVHALLLKLLAHQHARFFDGTCNSAGSKDWPWRFQLFLGNVAEAHRQCWRLSLENLPRFYLHVELNGSLVGRVDGLDDGTAAATLKVGETSGSGGSICNAAVLSKERGIASIVTRAHPDGPLHVNEETIVDGLFRLSPDTVFRFAKLMNPSSTAIVFCIDAPTITKTAVLKAHLVQISLQNTARSVCSFWCRQPLRIGLVSDACAVHLLRDGTLSFGPAHEACIVLEARTETKVGLVVIHSNNKASDSFLDAASVAQYELSAEGDVLRGTRGVESLDSVRFGGIACVARVDHKALGWPMRLRLDDPLTPAETERVAELHVKVPDCHEHERRLLLLEFYVQNLMADEERRKSRSRYAYHSPSVKKVEQEIDQHVRDSTESAEDTLQSVFRKLEAFPRQMQELFLANVLDMSPPYRFSGVVPLVPGLYTAKLAELIKTMEERVPPLAFDEARTMCLKAGKEKPPSKEDRHFDCYLTTPRSEQAWMKAANDHAANDQDCVALGYSRLWRQWKHVVRAHVPRLESISEEIDAQHAIALEFCKRVDSRLFTDADETAALDNATLARGMVCMYQRAVKVLSAFLTVPKRCKRRKVSDLKLAFRPLFEAINTLRLESSEVFEKKYDLDGLAEQDDDLILRMATTLYVRVDVHRTSKEDLPSNPLAARMIIERMGPLLGSLEGLVHFLRDPPPDAWKETPPDPPPQANVYCYASTAVVLVHLGNGSRVFLVLTDIPTVAGEKPEAVAKKLCEASEWFASGSAKPNRQPKRRTEGDVGSSSAGNGKKKKKKAE